MCAAVVVRNRHVRGRRLAVVVVVVRIRCVRDRRLCVVSAGRGAAAESCTQHRLRRLRVLQGVRGRESVRSIVEERGWRATAFVRSLALLWYTHARTHAPGMCGSYEGV